jgi:hypothetical protein
VGLWLDFKHCATAAISAPRTCPALLGGAVHSAMRIKNQPCRREKAIRHVCESVEIVNTPRFFVQGVRFEAENAALQLRAIPVICGPVETAKSIED